MAVPTALVERWTARADRSRTALSRCQTANGSRWRAWPYASAEQRTVAQPGHVGTGRVAVQDLQHEQVDGGDRVEHALAPDVAHGGTDLVDRIGREPVGELPT